jgi:hypothetical protein|tara:strand:+ start:1156 stop:1401 length:246 start_codon:yes stop_codon:yes gene_type:complete
MRAKEKAIELVEKFTNEFSYPLIEGRELKVYMSYFTAKQCALICVDEMLGIYDIEGYDGDDIEMAYLEEVKEEINKLLITN